MAQLSFDGIQPVMFGGKDCMPSLDAELRLRIQNLKFDTDADRAHSDEVLAKAFPKDRDYVEDFLKKQMSDMEKQKLQAYLLGGMSAVRTLDQAIERVMNQAMEGAKNE